MAKTFKFGITGGIGCGKTYVCDLFKKLGIEVYNTDDQVKSDIIRRESVRKQVIAEFGNDSYLADGSLNKEKFKQLLFTNSDQRTKMGEIITSELVDSINKWIVGKDDPYKFPYVLIECAVLFENGLDKRLHGVIVVSCPKELRIERLLNRGMTQREIDNVMGAQWSEEQKIERADFVLHNDGVEDINSQVVNLDKWLRK